MGIGSCRLLAAPLVLILLSSDSAQANLMLNPSFELGTGGTASNWGPVSYVSRSTVSPRTGSYSLQVTTGNLIGFPHIDSSFVPVVPGAQYSISTWGLHSSSQPLASGHVAILKAVWFGPGGWSNQLRTDETGFITSSDTANIYRQAILEREAPAGAENMIVQLMIYAPTQSTSSRVYFDDVSMVRVPEPTTVYALLILGSFAMMRRRVRASI